MDTRTESTNDIVVIGASAGGLSALKTLAEGLPVNFAGSIFVVIHTSTDSPRVLADAIDTAGVLPATYASDAEIFEPAHIYVAPPDYHLLVEPERLRLTKGPKENRFRPAVDPLFRSAAQAYGPRVIGVVLTGGLGDGTAGLQAIKRRGGTAIVQDPSEAYDPSMPSNALCYVEVDHCVRLNQIASLLVELTRTSANKEKGVREVPEDIDIEVRIAKEQRAIDAGVEKLGKPSSFSCPECHGVLLQIEEADPERFRCHTGHAYTIDALLSAMSEKTDDSLWTAVRSLDEEAMLMRHLSRHLEANDGVDIQELIKRARELESRGDLVRQATMSRRTRLIDSKDS